MAARAGAAVSALRFYESKVLISSRRNAGNQRRHAREVLRRVLVIKAAQRIAKLTRLRDQLDGCIGCGCLSFKVCPLRNPWDELSEQGPGPRLLDPDQARFFRQDAESSGRTSIVPPAGKVGIRLASAIASSRFAQSTRW